MTDVWKSLDEAILSVQITRKGNRHLDFEIATALGLVPRHTVRSVGFDYDWYRKEGEYVLWKAWDSEGRNVQMWEPNRYTLSIDATETLRISNAYLINVRQVRETCVWEASLRHVHEPRNILVCATHLTEALARTQAWLMLRVRLHREEMMA